MTVKEKIMVMNQKIIVTIKVDALGTVVLVIVQRKMVVIRPTQQPSVRHRPNLLPQLL